MSAGIFKILDVAPCFDSASMCSFKWNGDLLTKLRFASIPITFLLQQNAVSSLFKQHVGDHEIIIFFDHGNEDLLVGNDQTALLTSKDVALLKDKKVFAMACLSAKKLGVEAYKAGCLEYWGAVESIGFIPEEEALFGEVFIEGAYKRFGEEKTIEETLQSMKQHFDEQKNKTINPWTKIWLEKDKNMWVCWYEGNKPVEEPEPQKTWLQKLIDFIKKIIGIYDDSDSAFYKC